ncbi:hypothetical protein GWK47_000640 [Chionoecetes opilio]|uniref:Uncharacterized protein n=1 Tax=Chionoecetes opilio TaxID=41210 RepID=A0A8J4YDM3_CHIOP|nr:hypothetical protein GWK47_000640 [Chionoecetes opilio]
MMRNFLFLHRMRPLPILMIDEVVSTISDASDDAYTILSTARVVEHVDVRTEMQAWKLSSRSIMACLGLTFEVLSGGVTIVSCSLPFRGKRAMMCGYC